MSNVIAFTPRLRPTEPAAPTPLAGAALRASLEEAAETALDDADKIIAVLGRMVGDPEDEADPCLTAMAANAGQVFRLRESPEEPQVQAAAEVAPEPAPELDESPDPEAHEPTQDEAILPEPIFEPIRLPWRGAGNAVSAAGCALLALIERSA